MTMFTPRDPDYIDLYKNMPPIIANALDQASSRALALYSEATGINPWDLLFIGSTRRVAAIHEASHAVVHGALGNEPRRVRIFTEQGPNGPLWCGRFDGKFDAFRPGDSPAKVFFDSTGGLAGHVGEGLFAGIEAAASSIPEAVHATLFARDAAVLAGQDPHETIRAAWSIACNILQAEEPLVRRVATELEARKKLKHQHLRPLCRGLAARWKPLRETVEKTMGTQPVWWEQSRWSDSKAS